ncbi:SRPBCC domain-containing protein [Arthrobacter tumbae]|uniref:SRPBCC domain-containing protein n=1 Tax=Arthrobacter tumbae TaxID=163874 RepID=UPI00195C557A|nr:SRPBCC domain-containing protein [Arthrobacter tumbae]MBM7782040.1 uncharacterized protein YndB with AHSA1/START domain [Arthrobacter tumbae]
MDSLFSHSDADPTHPQPDTHLTSLATEVSVPRSPNESFAGFTDGIHLWWPVDQTRFGEGTHPEFTDGELFEEDAAGNSASWAAVAGKTSGGILELTWHHQGNPNFSSRVLVTFTPAGGSTHVSVVHDGWTEGELGREQRAAAPDWATVLASYRRFMGGAS